MSSERTARRTIRVTGAVQGVGFRPFVHGLAETLGLTGFVRNDAGIVLIEVEGQSAALDSFLDRLTLRPPPLARIGEVVWTPAPPRGEAGFRIAESRPAESGAEVTLPPDTAACEACLREVDDPRDRRAGYALSSCTACGPRLTIVESVPLDRERTTMAAFPLCAACRAEHEDPRDRRFHAQASACPACGPRLRLTAGGADVQGDPIAEAALALIAGRVVAVKGLGGWHLACAADREDAVGALRRRKARDEKPFALLVADLEAARALCELDDGEAELLTSPARPIVLCRRRAGGPVAAGVAPASDRLGLMLPYTPLHHLLARAAGRPLVLTSGNRVDEPIAYDDADAAARLGDLADAMLGHDRVIRTRCEDSVARVVDGRPLFLRRSRGHAPSPIDLGAALAVPTLATGGHLKAVFALGDGRRATPSHHLGDLDHPEALRAYREAIEHYERLHRFRPRRVVCDAHPDYASTRIAEERAAAEGLELVRVQHHHAHLAAVLADAGAIGERAIGVCFDGAGLGDDGTLWGGEFLVGGAAGAVRAGHLACVPLPGGERAMREPWRMAVAHVQAAGGDLDGLARCLDGVDAAALRDVARLAARSGASSPLTSSAGRLFDAVAAIAGVRAVSTYEGQAAIELEALAAAAPQGAGAYPFGVAGEDLALRALPGPIVTAALRDALAGVPAPIIAARFHGALVDLIVDLCIRLRAASGVATAALSGGVFANGLLTSGASARLADAGFRVLRHERVPPGDGGLALGQLAVLAARDGRS